jgi:hypothetical protein
MCLILWLEPHLHKTFNVIQKVVDLLGSEPPRLQDLSDIILSQTVRGQG